MATNPTPAQWAATVLNRLNIPQTPGAVQAMVGWAKAEGGHWNNKARYNPLNTTQPEPGAGNTGAQGNIKVYKSWDQGVDATVKTLNNGRYGGILQALKVGDPGRVADAIGKTPWGTSGDLVKRTIMGTPKVAGAAPMYQAQPSSPTSGSGSYQTSTPGVDNSPLRQQAALSYLQQGGIANSAATTALAGQYSALRDVPGHAQVLPSIPGRATGNPRVDQTVDTLKQQMKTIDAAHVPYLWGGGHQKKLAANSPVTPLDCSGAVSRALGLDPRVASQFKAWGAPGEGKRVTIYASDKHVFMKIDGHYFGTSRTNPGGGAGWIPQSAMSAAYLKGFVARHPPGA